MSILVNEYGYGGWANGGEDKSCKDMSIRGESNLDEELVQICALCLSKMAIFTLDAMRHATNIRPICGLHAKVFAPGKPVERMNISNIVDFGIWNDCFVCPRSSKSKLSISRLQEKGYGLKVLRDRWFVDELTGLRNLPATWVVNADSGERILKCEDNGGKLYIKLMDFLALPDLTVELATVSMTVATASGDEE